MMTGAVGAGVGLPLLAACGSASSEAVDPGSPVPTSTRSASGTASGSASGSASSSASSATPLVATTDVPVGGGVVLTDQQLVVTQPTQGQFHCFSAVCTHQGCLVREVTSTINCPCHGSMYDPSTGAVEGGPAPSPLPSVDITVKGGQVLEA